MRTLLLIILLHTTVSGSVPLPDRFSFQEQLTTLKKHISSGSLSPQEQQTASHEIHRIMLLVYITNAHGIERHARLSAQHALSRLYYAASPHQAMIRNTLSSFIDEVVGNRHLELSPSEQSEGMLTSIALLEERLSSLLSDDQATRELLFAFTHSMFGLVTKERITRKHVFLAGCAIVVGIAAIVVMLMLLNKIIETREELNEMTGQFMHNIDTSLARFADNYDNLPRPTLGQRAIIRLFGNSNRAQAARRRRNAA